MNIEQPKLIQILLVEDSPSDAKMTIATLQLAKMANEVSHVDDGVKALEFLKREGIYADAPRPDLILLDLNLPRMGGREVLEVIKADDDLKVIPVVVLTTSDAEEDILRSYQLHANCYICKPVNFDRFLEVITSIEQFWLSVIMLPGKKA